MKSIEHLSRQADQNARKVDQLEAQLARLTKPVSYADRNAVALAFRRADAIYQKLGLRTPMALPGESAMTYRRRLADPLRRFSPTFKNHAIHDSIGGPAFDHIESVVYREAEQSAMTVLHDSSGRLREVTTEQHGKTRVEFFGDPRAAWLPFMPPNRTLVRFND